MGKIMNEKIKGRQIRKWAVGMRPRIEAVPSIAMAPYECLLLAFASQFLAGQWDDRFGPRLDRYRRMGISGAGYRLPYPRTSRLASLTNGQGDDSYVSSEKCVDQPTGNTWSRRSGILAAL